MSFSIDAFRASLQNGLARKSNYRVIFSPPFGLIDDDSLVYRAVTATVPGRQIATVDNLIYGPPRKIAYNQVFTEARFTLITEPDLAEFEFLKQWQDRAVGKARGYNGPRAGMWDVGYYDDYVGEVEVQVFNDNGDEEYVCQLIDAYPVAVSDIYFEWGSDDFAMIDVGFTFHYVKDTAYTVAAEEDMSNGTP